MFLGANMDAVKEASSIGISRDYAVDYCWSAQGTSAAYDTIATAAYATKTCTIDCLDLKAVYDDCLTSSNNPIDKVIG
jgi:hypothetical protein